MQLGQTEMRVSLQIAALRGCPAHTEAACLRYDKVSVADRGQPADQGCGSAPAHALRGRQGDVPRELT